MRIKDLTFEEAAYIASDHYLKSGASEKDIEEFEDCIEEWRMTDELEQEDNQTCHIWEYLYELEDLLRHDGESSIDCLICEYRDFLDNKNG